jgi:hypothetical protein
MPPNLFATARASWCLTGAEWRFSGAEAAAHEGEPLLSRTREKTNECAVPQR